MSTRPCGQRHVAHHILGDVGIGHSGGLFGPGHPDEAGGRPADRAVPSTSRSSSARRGDEDVRGFQPGRGGGVLPRQPEPIRDRFRHGRSPACRGTRLRMPGLSPVSSRAACRNSQRSSPRRRSSVAGPARRTFMPKAGRAADDRVAHQFREETLHAPPCRSVKATHKSPSSSSKMIRSCDRATNPLLPRDRPCRRRPESRRAIRRAR